MPWRYSSIMDQRLLFIADYRRQVFSLAELCRRFQISRPTAYKWITRYEADGPSGLQDRERRPHRSPEATPAYVVEALLEARRRHPTWGAKKLLAILQRPSPRWPWPARSTACDLLKRHGLVRRRRRSVRRGHPGRPDTHMATPNATWTADFKGQFKTRDGQYCYPLTVADGYSRYLLACHGLDGTTHDGSRRVFRRLFHEYGLPERIRTDNGIPFASNALRRLSRLSVWWIRLGITPELIEPASPYQNGRHERMHKTLKAETTRTPVPPPRPNNDGSPAFVTSLIMTGPMKRSTNNPRRTSTSLHHAPCPIGYRRWNIPRISKCGASVATAAFGGTPIGSTSVMCWPSNSLVLKKSTPGCGPCTLAPTTSGGFTNGHTQSRTDSDDTNVANV